LDLRTVTYENVILMLLGVVDRSLRSDFWRKISPPWYERVWNEFCRIANLPVALQFDASIPLGPFFKLTMAVKDTPGTNEMVVKGLRDASSATFQDVVNEYFGRAEEIIKKKNQLPLIAILDGLDRIISNRTASGSYTDVEIFRDRATQLTSLRCRVIYTVRSALVHAYPTDLAMSYRGPFFNPMVPLRNRAGVANPASLDRLREVIEKRVVEAGGTTGDVFESAAIRDRLCQASGGHMRDLMGLVQFAVTKAKAFHGGFPIKASDVDDAIRDYGFMRRAQAEPLREPLRQVAEHKTISGLPPDVQQELLRNRLVHEYFDGDIWYDVCPLVAATPGNP
jgi:hypothetical protein